MKSAELINDSPIEWLSLDDYVANGGDSVLYVRVRGESMLDVGIDSGDLLVVNRIAKPSPNDVVVCETGGGYTIEKFSDAKTIIQPLRLIARNGEAVGMPIKRQTVQVTGVITHIVKSLGGGR